MRQRRLGAGGPLGSNSKFQLYQDPATKKYIMIGTEQSAATPGRSAFGPSANFRDANYQTFVRIENFRQYLG